MNNHLDNKRIAFIGFNYTEGFSYMENLLPLAFLKLGFSVKIFSSPIQWEKGKIIYGETQDYFTEDGIHISRLPFTFGNNFISVKLWKVKGLYDALELFSPSYIYHFGIEGLETKTTYKYAKSNPKVQLFYDCHAAFYNSGRNWISRNIINRLLFAPIARRAARYAQKIFYVGLAEKNFLDVLYNLPQNKLELFPLGDFILSDNEYKTTRETNRTSLGFSDNDIVILHSGKLNAIKRTEDIVLAFLEADQPNQKLVIIGSMTGDVSERVLPLINNNPTKIKYLGWKKSEELKDFLCATDVYVQFSVSSTFQTALCRRCIGITTNPLKTYNYIPDSVCHFINSRNDLMLEFIRLAKNSSTINIQKEISYEFAQNNLDYNKLVIDKIFSSDLQVCLT